jgi:hypothetical protein
MVITRMVTTIKVAPKFFLLSIEESALFVPLRITNTFLVNTI